MITDTWYSASLNQTTNPPTFSVAQTTEFRDTAAFTTGNGYIVFTILTHQDTMYVNKISSSQLILQENLSLGWDDVTVLSK